ncbi:hypothetical protein PR048_006421 [Dryococelus australis]|uniref:Uncharacterized protein n=1 Tax=Dryococelus australis TaxID=614101 RepID=A0ABQ9IAX4_9NEOP|nr:hypothetical protein PR048_006421 [Dryococelus australis]
MGQHVVSKYEEKYFPGVITNSVSSMKKSLKTWRCPQTKDEMTYYFDDIIGSIQPPKMLNHCGFFSVPELD